MFQRRSRSCLPPLMLAAATTAALAWAAMLPATAAGGFVAAGKLPNLGAARIWSVAVEPSVPSTILAATDAGVYVSRDSGISWLQTLPGVRVWVVGFDARTAGLALAGTSGSGIYISADAGSTWVTASTGLQNRDVRALAFGLDGIAAGTDAGVALSPDGRNWHDDGLDGYSIAAVAVAANSPQFTVIAGADSGQLSSGFLFSSTGGAAWEVLQSGLPSTAVVSSLTSGPIDLAVPKRPLLVATSQGTFRSGDGGTTWSPATGAPQGTTLTDVVYGPLDPALAYAAADSGGSTGGGFFRAVDGGQTFTAAGTGLPSTIKNVESIAVGTTNPPEVVVAIDPPTGGASVYTEVDTAAPAPPQLIAESPGAAVPSAVATAPPTATPTQQAVRPAPTPGPPGGLQQFASAAFRFPFPLVYEVIFVLLAVYVFIRWRQRYYVEGPP